MAGGSTDMDPQMASVLFHEGATLVFLDVPPGTEFGIDYSSWYVGPKFKGVKMIPPGIHFIHYSAVNKEQQAAPRTGFFYNFQQKQVLIKRWDQQLEDVVDIDLDEDRESIEANKRDLDRFLGPYPYESYRKWVALTSHITATLLDSLHPLCGTLSAATALQSEGSTTEERRKMAAALEAQLESSPPGGVAPTGEDLRLPEMKMIPGTEVRFTKIPTQKYPEGSTPTEITKYSLDHSFVLRTFLRKTDKDTDKQQALAWNVLGELQFAFLCFLIGQNYDGFEQWKLMVSLLCSSEEALLEFPGLFLSFITVLHHHLTEVPEDFFVDIVSADNFLTRTLQTFFSNLETMENPAEILLGLRSRGLKFRKHLEKKFRWDFTEEPEEFTPVVVE